MAEHPCRRSGCNETATHLVLESHPLALLFDSGAGLVCERDAEEMAEIGGIPISFEEIRKCEVANFGVAEAE